MRIYFYKLVTVTLFILSYVFPVKAEVLFFPQVGLAKKLIVSNPTNQDQTFWIQLKNSTQFQEIPFHISARASLTLNESEFSPDHIEYAIKSHGNALIAIRQLEDGTLVKANDQVSPHILYKRPVSNEDIRLTIQNHNFISQNIKVRYLSAQKEFLGQTGFATKDYFQSSQIILYPPSRCSYIEIISEGRINSRLETRTLSSIGDEVLETKVSVPNDKKYFLLSNPDRSDSFVVALEEPKWISMARDLIASPQNNKILFGRIRVDQQSWNRPLLSKNKTSWSWTVAEVTNFADLGSQSCDGNPSLVEEQLPIWLDQERICFWNFRVIKELSPNEINQGRLMAIEK